MTTRFEGDLKGEAMRIAIVVSRFNDFVTERLLAGAENALRRHGVADDGMTVAWVPGAFELPLVAQRLAQSGQHDAVIAIGAVIRGATGHYDHVAGQTSSGIARVALETGVPVIFGVLTTDTTDQALERAGVKSGNKGAESAVAAIEMVNLLRRLDKHASGT